LNFGDSDIQQMTKLNITQEQVSSHIDRFINGFENIRLIRPCTVGDGIEIIPESEIKKYNDIYHNAALAGQAMKFVPASGAATRMFKDLQSFINQYYTDKHQQETRGTKFDNSEHGNLHDIMKNIRKFAFFDELNSTITDHDLDIERLIKEKNYNPILTHLLTSVGLNYAELPKALIKFHQYENHSRSAIEEHLVEGTGYVIDDNQKVRIHFTISEPYYHIIMKHVDQIVKKYRKSGFEFDIGFSFQKSSTNTIAVDMDNRPFRDEEGELLFRPGGHGALLENLNDLDGEIIFVKNIDNVVPDRLKGETYKYKCLLGGYLISIQNEVFSYLKLLSESNVGEEQLKSIIFFMEERLNIKISETTIKRSKSEKIKHLYEMLNRPIRVCGMVKRRGEPGGGPFWVGENDHESLQIVETPQIDKNDIEQLSLLESSTHFSPTDLVCGVRDFNGNQFDLLSFRDPETGFITVKSKRGRKLKALELPGLWNGSMAHWITVFVEVPIITFNPVKTVNDLLRSEHLP